MQEKSKAYNIKKVERKQLNETKYTQCLKATCNYQLYAEIWYLDLQCGSNWDCYVWNDYEVIMPVTYQRFLFFNLVSLPIFSQQLGVFYKSTITQEMFNAFEKKLHKKIVRGYTFNEDNTENFQPKGKLRQNQFISLDDSYESIVKKYNRNRRRKLSEDVQENKIIQSQKIHDFISLFKTEYPNLLSSKWTKKLYSLMEISFEKEIGYQFRIEKDKKLIGGLFYIYSNDRLYQLGAARDKKIKHIDINTLIIDYVLKRFSNRKNSLLDFEGSDLQGVALFNKSFGADQKYYTAFTNLTFLAKFTNLLSSIKKFIYRDK